MGVNVLKAAQKSFEKSIDRAVEAVSNGDLFDQDPEECARRFLADPSRAAGLKVDDVIGLELQGDLLVGTRGMTKVLQADNPPPDVVQHIRNHGGIADGRVSDVQALSGLVEIELC